MTQDPFGSSSYPPAVSRTPDIVDASHARKRQQPKIHKDLVAVRLSWVVTTAALLVCIPSTQAVRAQASALAASRVPEIAGQEYMIGISGLPNSLRSPFLVQWSAVGTKNISLQPKLKAYPALSLSIYPRVTWSYEFFGKKCTLSVVAGRTTRVLVKGQGQVRLRGFAPAQAGGFRGHYHLVCARGAHGVKLWPFSKYQRTAPTGGRLASRPSSKDTISATDRPGTEVISGLTFLPRTTSAFMVWYRTTNTIRMVTGIRSYSALTLFFDPVVSGAYLFEANHCTLWSDYNGQHELAQDSGAVRLHASTQVVNSGPQQGGPTLDRDYSVVCNRQPPGITLTPTR